MRFSQHVKEWIESYAPYSLLAPIMRHRYRQRDRRVQDHDPEEIFSKIYQSNNWGDSESVSGGGSSIAAAEKLSKALPDLCKRHHVSQFLDVPCGDCNWIKHIDLGVEQYIGGDIVAELIERHQKEYASPLRRFIHLDLTRDSIPAVDLMMVRDCFIHLSFEHIFQALKNIKQSQASFLLTTTYPYKKRNWDIETGGFRPVNLQKPPFNLPAPLESIDDTERASTQAYFREMALWRVKDL